MACARKLWGASVLLAAIAGPVLGADSAADGITRTVEVAVDQAHGEQWTAVDPRTVFRSGDEIHFRFQSNFFGYLYVLDRTSAGDQMWLFPTEESGTDNEVQANREYLIPATEGAFRIPEDPGYDTVFWIVSPVPLTAFTGVQLPQPVLKPLLPRCREAVSHCLDSAAGARSVDRSEIPVTSSGPLRARDVTLNRSPSSMKISASMKGPGALIYEIRIAHR